MISEVVSGVLVEVIVTVGHRLAASAVAFAGRQQREDLRIARWFDTYQLTSDPPEFPDLPPGMSKQLVTFLQGDNVQAALHELMAVRLTDAPEADAERVRSIFDMALGAAQPETIRVAGELFSYFDGQICALTGRLKRSEPTALAQIRAEALSARMIAILGAIERHAAILTASSHDVQGESAFLEAYRRHVVGHHGQIDLPDFERRLRLPIADLYVTPIFTQISNSEIFTQATNSGQPGGGREIDLWTLADEVDRVVLLGHPGGGKTTAANVLMHYHASNPRRKIPFLVTLREFAGVERPERSVVGYIEHRLEVFYQCSAPPGLIPRLLLTGVGLVIFDGLDELLNTARRLEVTAIVERFCTEYPLTPVLVTSRVVGYDEARLDERQFSSYRIDDFSDSQVAEYARKWFARDDTLNIAEAGRSADAFLEESASVPDLRVNPLMLALMCILYRGEGSLPHDRAEVYGRCAILLYQKWDTRRRIHLELRAGNMIEQMLRHLAWWLFTRSQAQPAVPERELIRETTAFLTGRGFGSDADARQAAEEFISFCRGRMWVFTDTGTSATGERLYSFAHRTFLEYFAAARLAYERDTPELLARALAPRVARHEWEVVSELALQLKDHTSERGAQRAYVTLLGERRRRSPAGRSGILQFLARCLRSVDPSTDTVRVLTRNILDHLFSGDPSDLVHALPLCWLLACCDRHRDIVRREIDSRVAKMAGSSEPSVRLYGARLAAFLPFGPTRGDGGPSISPDRPIRQFWWEHATELLQAHASTVTEAAADDDGMRFAALWWRIITLDQALDMPGGVSSLFRQSSQGISTGVWTSYLPNIVHWLMSEDLNQTRLSQFSDDLTAFGNYLIAHPDIPWLNGPVGNFHYILLGDDPETEVPGIAMPLPDETTYLGAAAALLIMAESIKTAEVLKADYSWPNGPLRELYPYIRRRWQRNSAIQLPNLPIPDPFGQIFRDWAEDKISMIGTNC